MQSSSGLIPQPANISRTSRNQNDRHDTDLISFANPDDNTISGCLTTGNPSNSSNTSSFQDSHDKLKQIVNDIHRYISNISKYFFI